MRYSWRLNPTVLGLTVLTISPGVSGLSSHGGTVTPKQRDRAIIETAVIGLTAAHLTKSWWPLTGPLMYAGFDYVWSMTHNVEPAIGVTDNGY